MERVYFTQVNTELGQIFAASSDIGLCRIGLPGEDLQKHITWLSEHFDHVEENFERNESVVNQLIDYAQGKLRVFDAVFHLIGTPFQKKVWSVLADVPYGEVCSYKDLAIKAQSPKGFRAVGMANNRNPIPIIMPCHRVIGHNGDLIGYGGGLDMKKRLLELEGRIVYKGKVVTEK